MQFIVNIKPWLLAAHPRYDAALKRGAFVRPAPDAEDAEAAMSWTWAAGFASHKPGSYYDYSSRAACEFWDEQIRAELLAHGLTGMWIDNNEISGLEDDEERFVGEVGVFGNKGGSVETRMGWGGGEIRVGSVGKAVQTMGMARVGVRYPVRHWGSCRVRRPMRRCLRRGQSTARSSCRARASPASRHTPMRRGVGTTQRRGKRSSGAPR